MRRRLALAAVLCLIAVPAMAAAASNWTVDRAASSVRFASAMGGQAFSGAFRRWDAQIRFDPSDLAGSSVIATIDVASAVTGDAQRDEALPTPTFLSADRFPKAMFAATSFKSLGGGRYLAIGQLSLRGVVKPLTLPFTLAITGPRATMTASLALNRLAFGVGQNEWKSTDTLPANVTVSIAITAIRAK